MRIKKFQTGGQMASQDVASEAVPTTAPEAQDPMMQLVEAAMAALESQDPNLAMQVCQMLLELVGAAPAPVGQPAQGAPVFRRGGRIAYRTRK